MSSGGLGRSHEDASCKGRPQPAPKQSFRRVLSPGPTYYCLALAFFVVVFGIIPLSIYAHSGDDWGFPYHQTLLISAVGLTVCFATFLVIRLIALAHVSTAAAIACALFCIGLFLLLAHVYAPIQIGPLDGSEIESEEPLRYTLVEIGLLVLVLVVFFSFDGVVASSSRLCSRLL